MKPENQIRVLAEGDGYILMQASDGAWEVWKDGKSIYADADPSANFIPQHILPNYLTSYDAILPLIQKQHGIGNRFEYRFIQCLCEVIPGMPAYGDAVKTFPECYTLVVGATPAQLAEALIRAWGKWEEE